MVTILSCFDSASSDSPDKRLTGEPNEMLSITENEPSGKVSFITTIIVQ